MLVIIVFSRSFNNLPIFSGIGFPSREKKYESCENYYDEQQIGRTSDLQSLKVHSSERTIGWTFLSKYFSSGVSHVFSFINYFVLSSVYLRANPLEKQIPVFWWPFLSLELRIYFNFSSSFERLYPESLNEPRCSGRGP